MQTPLPPIDAVRVTQRVEPDVNRLCCEGEGVLRQSEIGGEKAAVLARSSRPLEGAERRRQRSRSHTRKSDCAFVA
jgi:hypothetical protein